MAIVLEKKNGGPYTKKEQEQRRDKVYSLHFEKGHSAVKIAEMISVNRNTVNEDIKFWYSQISDDLQNSTLAESWAIKQYDRLESQRCRLISELEGQEKLRDKISLEKMILDIDEKISQLALKIRFEKKEPEENEKKIQDIARQIVLNQGLSCNLEEEKILYEIINITKCSVTEAEQLIEEMEELGLGLNRSLEDEGAKRYDLLKFVELREYFHEKELDKIYERLEKDKKFIQIMKDAQKKYESEYGPDRAKWPKEILDDIRKQINQS